jgi:hypothetical protein
MAEEWLTYSALGERLGISPEAARQKALRYRWPRRPANDGKTQVRVDVEDVKASGLPRKPREASDGRSTPEPPPVEQASDARALLDALEAHIATLKGTTAKAEEIAAQERDRADAERSRADRERERADVERARADELQRHIQEADENEASARADMERRIADLTAAVGRMRRPWWKRLAG